MNKETDQDVLRIVGDAILEAGQVLLNSINTVERMHGLPLTEDIGATIIKFPNKKIELFNNLTVDVGQIPPVIPNQSNLRPLSRG